MAFPSHVKLVISLTCFPFETCSDVPPGNLELHLHSATKFPLTPPDRAGLKAYVEKQPGATLITKPGNPDDVLVAFSDKASARNFIMDLAEKKRVVDHWECLKGKENDKVSRSDDYMRLCSRIDGAFDKFERDQQRGEAGAARGFTPRQTPARRTTDPREIGETQTGAVRGAAS